ncbi:hypothetical protein IMG5_108000 [Ichthyophthirius multifiliis]|uniref:Uncharacterized protein n=1 Tax=Ichthyophthirius multifiliis TaxID=5932 RepID=G0QTF6_ICHMU|nr:hypothetical protein IMG5_108000 [Ichthyophthirius multifiliis]EGR31499.1 hypothetical protein IMG5_108000 [Ichthyophthirius multifiliis]|eukprot:XP_004034985.1 hypothetical protein IMG5_108000 [Ichthyophthirius multifiliis]
MFECIQFFYNKIIQKRKYLAILVRFLLMHTKKLFQFNLRLLHKTKEIYTKKFKKHKKQIILSVLFHQMQKHIFLMQFVIFLAKNKLFLKKRNQFKLHKVNMKLYQMKKIIEKYQANIANHQNTKKIKQKKNQFLQDFQINYIRKCLIYANAIYNKDILTMNVLNVKQKIVKYLLSVLQNKVEKMLLLKYKQKKGLSIKFIASFAYNKKLLIKHQLKRFQINKYRKHNE